MPGCKISTLTTGKPKTGRPKTIYDLTATEREAIRPGGGVLPYMGYIGMSGPKEYGFSAVLVIDRVSILANFGQFGHKWGMVFTL